MGGEPVPGAVLASELDGRLASAAPSACTDTSTFVSAAASQVLSDANGRFRTVLHSFFGAGTHCLRLVASAARAGAAPDSVQYRLRVPLRSGLPDSVAVAVTFP